MCEPQPALRSLQQHYLKGAYSLLLELVPLEAEQADLDTPEASPVLCLHGPIPIKLWKALCTPQSCPPKPFSRAASLPSGLFFPVYL